MKQFEIPAFYRSPIISKVKAHRKLQDPRKKDFTPTTLDFGNVRLHIARHFGFCYGVENAIEIAYRAIAENEGKRIYLLSEMIHNPGVNQDLLEHGIKFLQDTAGNQLIDWTELTADDIVIIPAFGTTLKIEEQLRQIGIEPERYNTTCPFVEKVWNRSEKLAAEQHTLIIHGKYNHEETRATFSHTTAHTHAVIIKDITEAQKLAKYITGETPAEQFFTEFAGKYSEGFDPQKHLNRMGVINQTTMLATETQEIAEYLKSVTDQFAESSGAEKQFADTRDTLCYATNDNQSATLGLRELELDLAIVVGGYNSSNTTHLVELLEEKTPTYFVRDESELIDSETIFSFDIHSKERKALSNWIPKGAVLNVAITSGASCPDATVDRVIEKLLSLLGAQRNIEEVIQEIS
jgi:4-hydroxy-3-methylbut-2-enyl diphosphate reductase